MLMLCHLVYRPTPVRPLLWETLRLPAYTTLWSKYDIKETLSTANQFSRFLTRIYCRKFGTEKCIVSPPKMVCVSTLVCKNRHDFVHVHFYAQFRKVASLLLLFESIVPSSVLRWISSPLPLGCIALAAGNVNWRLCKIKPWTHWRL